MMFVDMIKQWIVVLLIASTWAQVMPQAPFPYPYQQGQPMMQMLGVPNGQSPMQMAHPGSMPMANGPMPLMMPHMPRLPGMPSGPPPFPMQFPIQGGKAAHGSGTTSLEESRQTSEKGDGSCSESAEFRSKNKLRSKKKRKHEVLTPVVSYVTKDGYVVYQKKIKKDKAKDWLEMTKGEHDSDEDTIRFKPRDHDH
ncbi:hypothetical protein HW555_011667 [Spodoptera exigua]|uniref:Uncharacterized protein n=1 Tax=Spodoptera exigua TaxID=7107 RepID=A0A835G4W2_SPOEX|nr:hypothetical protein HW555_011667 [Spodoptera exigua]